MTAGAAKLRRDRERDLVSATRAIFDARGVLDAPVEEIAQSVGIARGLIYRQFSSKEELYVLTVTDYLDELAGVLRVAMPQDAEPAVRLRDGVGAYAQFCARYPAFLDSALSLMKRPARDLHETVSESIWLRLGQGMATCIDPLAGVLRTGSEAGVFDVEDPEYTANVVWTQVLGTMHLARIGVGVRQVAPGIPGLFSVDPDRVAATCVDSALAMVGARAGP